MIKLVGKSQVSGLQQAIRELNKLDKSVTQQLRKDLKTELMPEAKELAADVNVKPPLSGFIHDGRTRWAGVRASVSFTPIQIRSKSNVHPAVTIKLTGKAGSSGFDIAEMAGTRDLRYSDNRKQGAKFVKNLQKRSPFKFKGGRFGYGEFLKKRKGIQKKAVKVIDKFAKKFNKKVSR